MHVRLGRTDRQAKDQASSHSRLRRRGLSLRLLPGLYNEYGLLDHIGFTPSFSAPERRKLKTVLPPYSGGKWFSGKAPGGSSRWSTGRTGEWEPLKPELVCEVRYDHFSGGRFRDGTKFLHWRPEKRAEDCTCRQLETAEKRQLKKI